MAPARIVEVNGVNVNQENHKQVVARIKSIENETKLLGIVQKSDNLMNYCNAMQSMCFFVAKATSNNISQIFRPCIALSDN